jgi:hypothetical protein
VQDLSHVEVCLNCSSRTLRMVTDVFYYALKRACCTRSNRCTTGGARTHTNGTCQHNTRTHTHGRIDHTHTLARHAHTHGRIDKRLRPLCARALERTFVMCDADGDGALCDAEVNHFQQAGVVCFGGGGLCALCVCVFVEAGLLTRLMFDCYAEHSNNNHLGATQTRPH